MVQLEQPRHCLRLNRNLLIKLANFAAHVFKMTLDNFTSELWMCSAYFTSTLDNIVQASFSLWRWSRPGTDILSTHRQRVWCVKWVNLATLPGFCKLGLVNSGLLHRHSTETTSVFSRESVYVVTLFSRLPILYVMPNSRLVVGLMACLCDSPAVIGGFQSH